MARTSTMSVGRKSEIKDGLKNIYYNLKSPASFGNSGALYRYVKSLYPDLTLKFVTDWLKEQFTYVIHQQTKKPKTSKFAKFVSFSPNLNVDCDVAFLGYNKRKPALVCVDAFSSYIMAQPLLHVNSKNVNNAFVKMIQQQSKFPSYPLQIRSDAGISL